MNKKKHGINDYCHECMEMLYYNPSRPVREAVRKYRNKPMCFAHYEEFLNKGSGS